MFLFPIQKQHESRNEEARGVGDVSVYEKSQMKRETKSEKKQEKD